jgi:hypothetical protein
MRRPARCLAAALALALAPSASAREVNGVAVPETIELDGRILALNGAGVRTSFFFHVYVGALYLPRRSSDFAAILAADEPWEITMVFLRDVDHEHILDSFRHAVARNARGRAEEMQPGLVAFHDRVLSELTMHHGELLALDYVPGAGATLTAPGGAHATVAGKAFADALLHTWLGDAAADHALREAMLGRAGPAASPPRAAAHRRYEADRVQ